MVKVIISTMLDLFSCGPCRKLKTQLQDDDADIWNDLTLVYAVPGAKPPNIPKVVKVVSDSDTDDDVSTLYESSFHNRQHNWNRRDMDDDDDDDEEEKSSSSPSLTTPRRTFNNTEMKAETTEDDCSPMYGHDLELEKVLEEIDLSDADDDESLESIMGPRSQVVSVTSSRHSRRTSSLLPVTFSPISLPLPSTRPISLLQQEREQYHGMMSDESSLLLPLSARPPSLIHQERGQYHVAMPSLRGRGEEDGKKESCSLLPLSARPPSLLQQQREKFSNIFPREDYKEEDYRDDEFFCDDDRHDHDDGSSYSSACQKMSFFKKKMNAFPSSNGNGKNIMWKMSSSAITSNNSGWQILQGDSTDTSSTVQTQNRRPHHILSTLRTR
jgi:hypothetical protein